MGKPGIPGGAGVRLGGCGAGPVGVARSWLKVRLPVVLGVLRHLFFCAYTLKGPGAVPLKVS